MIPATLPDGTAYQPVSFLDANTSVGTAPSKDGDGDYRIHPHASRRRRPDVRGGRNGGRRGV